MSAHTAFARPRFVWLALALVIPAFGCSSNPPTYPAQGRVVLKDGRPFTEGVVEFTAASAGSKTPAARGRIQPDGTFRLTTFRENDGAVEGEHRAVLIWSPPADAFAAEDVRKHLRSPIHPRFRDYDRSGLRFTVTRGRNEFVITVEAPPPGTAASAGEPKIGR